MRRLLTIPTSPPGYTDIQGVKELVATPLQAASATPLQAASATPLQAASATPKITAATRTPEVVAAEPAAEALSSAKKRSAKVISGAFCCNRFLCVFSGPCKKVRTGIDTSIGLKKKLC